MAVSNQILETEESQGVWLLGAQSPAFLPLAATSSRKAFLLLTVKSRQEAVCSLHVPEHKPRFPYGV